MEGNGHMTETKETDDSGPHNPTVNTELLFGLADLMIPAAPPHHDAMVVRRCG